MPPHTQNLHLVAVLFLLLVNVNNEIIICYSSSKVIVGPSTSEKQLSVKTRTPSLIITVDQNPAPGYYTTIQAAIDSIPTFNNDNVLINVHAGIYIEKVNISAFKANIKIQGAGAETTVVQWGDTASTLGPDGKQLGTFGSATFGIDANYFIAMNMTFQNTAPIPPPGVENMQGVALRITGDAAAFVGCRILGAQDTLYDHLGRHYYQDCYIEGCVDFIFGDGRSYFKDCELHAIAPGAVTAQVRNFSWENTGFSLVNCRVTGSAKVFLGRAWGTFSTVIFSYTYMADNVEPEGWFNWGVPEKQSTVFYREYACTGPGANTQGRVTWSKTLTDEEAKPFLSLDYIDASEWLDLS